MKRRRLNFCCRWVSVLVIAAMPLTTLAAPSEQEHEVYDARLEGYSGNVTLNGGGQAMSWIAFILLGVLACAGLFKDAKRTHLD